MVAVVGKGGMATATALAATMTTLTMMTTIPRLLLLMSLSLGTSVFAALDQQRRWDGKEVAVVDKVGRTAVDRDKCNGATCCNDDDHPLPIIVDVFVIGCLSLCSARSTTAVGGRWGSGRRQGGEDSS